MLLESVSVLLTNGTLHMDPFFLNPSSQLEEMSVSYLHLYFSSLLWPLCNGLNCVPPKCYVEALILTMVKLETESLGGHYI